MLWINLIMDTFAALALASLPPDYSVMHDKPRSRQAYIITKEMASRIVGMGLFFVAVLFGFIQYFKHCEVPTLAHFSLHDYLFNFFNFSHVNAGIDAKELSLLFTIFVFMQFWNIFNAKAFRTQQSALKGLGDCRGFLLTLLIIFVGQILIVNFGGEMFNVVPLPMGDWLRIIGFTSLILWIGEVERLVKRRFAKA